MERMNHTDSTEHSGHGAHIVVHPPNMTTRPPYRGVEILGTVVGKAYNLADVEEFARRAGLEDVDVAQSEAVAWVGGGPGFWGADTGE
jgi:hypothetical protein